MAKTKFYAVKKGNKEGVYNTWAECKEQVCGYKGAVYKSFSTYKEAEDFLKGVDSSDYIINDCENKAIAYVDGSYNKLTNDFSYGAIIFYKSQKYEFSKKFNNQNGDMRNIAGEIEGAKMAMQFCKDNDIDELDIYYDYQGRHLSRMTDCHDNLVPFTIGNRLIQPNLDHTPGNSPVQRNVASSRDAHQHRIG